MDRAEGVMQEGMEGGGRFVSVCLHPTVEVESEEMIQKANELHRKANEHCFIANSCNFAIDHQPTCKVLSAKNQLQTFRL